VQHVEAEADRRCRNRGDPPERAERELEISAGEDKSAGNGEARLAEARDEELDESGVDQSADAEAGDDASNERKAQPEAQVQICADIGKRTPSQRALEKSRDQHHAGERIGQDRGIAAEQATLAAAARFAGLRIDSELEQEP